MLHSSVNLKVHKTDMSPKSQALTLLVLFVCVASAQKPFLECPSKNRDVMVSYSHLSKGLSDLKQNATQEKNPFPDTVLHALSHGVICFESISFKNQQLEARDWLLKNSNHSEGGSWS